MRVKMIDTKPVAGFLAAALLAGFLSGCGGQPATAGGQQPASQSDQTAQVYTPEKTDGSASADESLGSDNDISETASTAAAMATVNLGALVDFVPLSSAPAISLVLNPEASGTAVQQNGSAVIDYSNIADGYVMVKWIEGGTPKLKVLLKGPSGTTYQYNLRTDGEYEVFPLSDGSGAYTAGVYRNISGKEYATVLSISFNAALMDEFAPFVRPNQYVNFKADSAAVAKAAELCTGIDANLAKVEKVYNFVIGNTTYDAKKAKSVKSGYLPDVDETLRTGTGICFDYASLMAAMLRSQGVPVKLVVGYTGSVYHSWLTVWSETEGWIEGKIYFDGTNWKLMDPTFASNAGSSDQIMQYIGNNENYSAKYLY